MFRLTISLRLFAVLILCIAQAHAQMTLTGAGGTKAATVTSYTGPGDVLGSALAYWGLRAYSSATRGNKAINLCDDTGANCTDISTNASTGNLNSPGTLGSNNCTTSGTCRIKTFYDQTGALSCGGSACDVTQATNADRPTLTWSCNNSLPCAVFTGSPEDLVSAVALVQAQPFYVMFTAKPTGNTNFQDVLGSTGIQDGFGTGTALCYAGTAITAPATNNAWHIVQIVQSNTTGTVANCLVDNVSGSTTGQNTGTLSGSVFLGSSSAPDNYFVGNFAELALWAGNQGSSNTAICHNAFTYWGTSTSC